MAKALQDKGAWRRAPAGGSGRAACSLRLGSASRGVAARAAAAAGTPAAHLPACPSAA